jgi:hypothetical protein
MTWITGMIDLIRQCLNVDEHERPDAIFVYKSLFRPQAGQGERLKSEPNPQQSLPEPGLSSIDSSSPSGPTKYFRKILPVSRRISQSSSQHPTQQLHSSMKMRSLSTSSSITSASANSASDFMYTSGSVEMLVQRGNAKHAAIDPEGQHVVLCFSQEALIFDLMPNLEMRLVPGTYDYINLARHYLILYEKSSLQVRRCVSCIVLIY